MLFLIEKSVLLFTFLFIMNSFASEQTTLDKFDEKYQQLNILSNTDMKNMSFEEFKSKLGFTNTDTLIIKKDGLKNFRTDGHIFYKEKLLYLYTKFCSSRGGSMYQKDSIAGCIQNKAVLFSTSYNLYIKPCSFMCDYMGGKDFDRSEFTLDSNMSRDSEILSNYQDFLVSVERNKKIEQERQQNYMAQKQKQYETQQVKMQEIANQKNALKSRKGNFVMDFFTQYNGYSSCEKSCKSLNGNNNGYFTIEEAVQDGWTVSQVLSDSSTKTGSELDEYGNPKNGNDCQCNGKKYFMQKK